MRRCGWQSVRHSLSWDQQQNGKHFIEFFVPTTKANFFSCSRWNAKKRNRKKWCMLNKWRKAKLLYNVVPMVIYSVNKSFAMFWMSLERLVSLSLASARCLRIWTESKYASYIRNTHVSISTRYVQWSATKTSFRTSFSTSIELLLRKTMRTCLFSLSHVPVDLERIVR